MWIKAKNGNVFETVTDDLAADLVKQGHLAFATQAEAKKAKTPKDIVPEGAAEAAPEAE